MNRIPVVSENLNAVGYDSNSQILRIWFNNGTYDYFGVPEHIFNGLMNAPSKGRYHHQYIKDRYRFTKV
ncbi:KTSC domain-containing protein [Metabacillus dongyingensis]|uniref:KTSC domain-containing protein n=1 Tax=Metabacillus dongyingensis TaxID=2874282 RepID=UPI003B8B475D